jgi:hypothetical protein
MATAIKTKTRPPTTGTLIDQLWAVREEKRTAEKVVSDLSERITELEGKVMENLEANGLDKATGTKASVSVSSSVAADVQDWEALWAFIVKKKFTHLIQKRVSDPAYRELLEAGMKVPGVVPFTKRRVNLRSLNS